MSNLKAKMSQEGIISAVVTRADGTKVDLGIVAANYHGTFKMWKWILVGSKISALKINKFNRQQRKLMNGQPV